MLLHFQLQFTINILDYRKIYHQVDRPEHHQDDHCRDDRKSGCYPVSIGCIHDSLATYPTPRIV